MNWNKLLVVVSVVAGGVIGYLAALHSSARYVPYPDPAGGLVGILDTRTGTLHTIERKTSTWATMPIDKAPYISWRP